MSCELQTVLGVRKAVNASKIQSQALGSSAQREDPCVNTGSETGLYE